MSLPKISIIMPAFNVYNYIEESIDSILNQTESDFELLICDDGSTDGTYEILQRKLSEDKRIKLYKNSKNLGNLKTTNFLFKECKGRFIGIQDADDISINTRLKLLCSELEKDSDLYLVGSNYLITDENLNPLSCGKIPYSDDEIKSEIDKSVPHILYGSILFRREILDKIGDFRSIFNRKGFADLDWLYRVCENFKVKNIKEVAYYYRQNGINKYPRKSIIEFFGLELLVQAHKHRINGLNDFLEENDTLFIKKFVSKIYLKRAEVYYFNSDFKNSKKFFLKSFYLYPFNLYVVKNIIKILISRN